MRRILKVTLAVLALFVVVSTVPAGAAPSERRMALVIGNASYRVGALATAANDAGLIAQTLRAAGFDVMGARDLDEDSLRNTLRDFVDHASKAGPDAVVAVYFAGYGMQLEGENYLLPIDANIARDSDLPNRALRLSEYTHALAALRLKATIVVVDAARVSPFSLSGQPLAGGLAWVESEPGMLLAFNATPGTVAPEGRKGYGPYAKALAEMIRGGGLQPVDVFDRVRLRVNDITKGAQVPWDASQIEAQFVFFERGPGAPPPVASHEQIASMRSRPMNDLGAQDAYLVTLLRDTFDGYADFLAAYPYDPMARRVRAILAARREAITWRRTYQADTPEAGWSYLKRYPRGPHAADARRLLVRLSAGLAPPPRFTMIEYDMPTPLPDELEFSERPVLIFDDPVFAFAPPPSPVHILEPPPPELAELEPPPPPDGAHTLPVPVFAPVPIYISPPAYVVAPPKPVVSAAANNTTNVATIAKPDGRIVASAPNSPPGVAVSAPAVGTAPFASIAPKAALINSQSPAPPTANPATTGAIALLPSQPLPAMFPTSPILLPPVSGNTPVPNLPVATLWPPTSGNIPPPIPSVANLLPPTTSSLPALTPSAATLAPLPISDELLLSRPLSNPFAATLSPSASPPVTSNTLPSNPLAATLAPPANGKVPLPIPRPAILPPPAPVHQAAPSTPSVVLQPAPPVTAAVRPPSRPPLSSASPPQATARPPSAAKPLEKTCFENC